MNKDLRPDTPPMRQGQTRFLASRLVRGDGLGFKGCMLRHDIPYAAPGQRIGLMGGSFDPAHGGHVHLSKQALVRFGLDAIWWLVTPGNPLKENGPQPLARRVNYARGLVDDPRIVVTDIEARLDTRYSIDTLGAICDLFPRTHFAWIMGADNLEQLHLWKDWQAIMHLMPIGVLARPGSRMAARRSVAARVFEADQVSAASARDLTMLQSPAWAFVNMPMSDQSSTEIRAKGNWF